MYQLLTTRFPYLHSLSQLLHSQLATATTTISPLLTMIILSNMAFAFFLLFCLAYAPLVQATICALSSFSSALEVRQIKVDFFYAIRPYAVSKGLCWLAIHQAFSLNNTPPLGGLVRGEDEVWHGEDWTDGQSEYLVLSALWTYIIIRRHHPPTSKVYLVYNWSVSEFEIMQSPATASPTLTTFNHPFSTHSYYSPSSPGSHNSFRKILAAQKTTVGPSPSDIQGSPSSQEMELGLESERSKFHEPLVKSSIDSQRKNKVSSSSIPLSELIQRDMGYDFLFQSKEQTQKLERKYFLNLKELKDQTEEQIDLVSMHILALEEQTIKKRIQELEREIKNLKQKRESKSPINTDYQAVRSKRKERFSGRLLKIHNKENRSNMRTQCDSKGPSLSSTPLTPVTRRKDTTPQKHSREEYVNILRAKRQAIKDSLFTVDTYFSQRIAQAKLQNTAIKQQISWIDSQFPSLRTHKTNYITEYFDRPLSANRSRPKKRLMGAYSPRSTRGAKKGYLIPRPELRTDPQDEYLTYK